MANTKVVLMRRVKTDKGWGHYPAAYAANGRVKPGVVIVAGHEVKHTTGYYELRYYDGAQPVYEALPGAGPTEADYKRKKKAAELSARVVAKKAGVQVVPADPQRKTLASELKQFLAEKVDRGSLEAAEVYKLACDEFLVVTGRQYVNEVVPEDLAKFHKALAARGMGKRTVSNRHASVKAFLRYLNYDTKDLPKPPKYDKTLPEINADTDLAALFAAVTSPRENLLYRVMVQTGAREQEAMHLEWTDINPERKILKLQSKVKRWGFRIKDFEERELPLTDDLLERLMDYKRDHAGTTTLIFPKEGKPDGHMLRTLKRQVRAAGLNCGKCDGCLGKARECENWYLHKFRATYCTKLLRSGLDIRTVQQMMGHGDLASTMRYLRPAENEQTQARINAMNWW
jgi:integrase